MSLIKAAAHAAAICIFNDPWLAMHKSVESKLSVNQPFLLSPLMHGDTPIPQMKTDWLYSDNRYIFFVCVSVLGCDVFPQLQVGTRPLTQHGVNPATLTSSENLSLWSPWGLFYLETCDLDSCSQGRCVAAGAWIVSKCQAKVCFHREDAGPWNELYSSLPDQYHYPCDKAVHWKIHDFEEEQLHLIERRWLFSAYSPLIVKKLTCRAFPDMTGWYKELSEYWKHSRLLWEALTAQRSGRGHSVTPACQRAVLIIASPMYEAKVALAILSLEHFTRSHSLCGCGSRLRNPACSHRRSQKQTHLEKTWWSAVVSQWVRVKRGQSIRKVPLEAKVHHRDCGLWIVHGVIMTNEGHLMVGKGVPADVQPHW